MHRIQRFFYVWLQTGVYIRLYVPLALLILVVGGFRYYLLIDTEVIDARQRSAAEMRQVAHFLIPTLKELSATQQSTQIQELIAHEIQTSDQISDIRWHYLRGSPVHIHSQNRLIAAPQWFVALLQLTESSFVQQLDSAQGIEATLEIYTSPATAINTIWYKVRTQAKVSVAIIFAIFFLLSLILRANAKTLAELAAATVRFKQGEHAVRMKVAGSVESRALANTFNSMTEEVQKLFRSLQLSRHELASEKERVETTLASIGEAVISTDLDGRILTMNKAADQLTGWQRDDAVSVPMQEVFILLDLDAQEKMHEFLVQLGVGVDALQFSNQTLIDRSGLYHEVDCTAAPIKRDDGTVIGCVLVFRDVSEKRLLMQQISWQAGHDKLTGLENRSLFSERLKLAIMQANVRQHWLAVCLLDIDYFQLINEQYGPEIADKLLQQVARRLEIFVGAGNYVAHLGGDEFVVLMQVQKEAIDLNHRLTPLLEELSRPYQCEQKQIALTSSVGVATYPRDDINPDTLLRCADQAMYQAKLSGRNQFHLFDAQQDQQVRTHHNQRTRIRSALLDGEFRLYFQPKVNMRKGQIIGMEALLRWQHPDQGIVGPLQFLPMVEHTDLIISIGEWVLQQAMAQLLKWSVAHKDWVVSVNIAARHFQCADFLSSLTAILAQYPEVSPSSLEIEILESAAIQDMQHVREVMIACQQLGVRFALDDFGTGYSSLAYLKRLPANILKIDQSFVRNMLGDQENLALISAVIGLADAFRREVIAEGVESPEHGVALMELGCDFAQGYGIARPMPADAVDGWANSYKPAVAWALQGEEL